MPVSSRLSAKQRSKGENPIRDVPKLFTFTDKANQKKTFILNTNTFVMAIPVVDLADFSGDAKQKASFVDALGKAYEDVGFVAVKNHGITNEAIEELYS